MKNSLTFFETRPLCARRLSVIPIDQEAPRIPRTSSTGNFWLINHQQITIIIIYNCSLQIPCTEEPSSCLLVIYITHRSCKLTASNLRFTLRTVCKLCRLNEMMCHGSFVYEEGICETKLSRSKNPIVSIQKRLTLIPIVKRVNTYSYLSGAENIWKAHFKFIWLVQCLAGQQHWWKLQNISHMNLQEGLFKL